MPVPVPVRVILLKDDSSAMALAFSILSNSHWCCVRALAGIMTKRFGSLMNSPFMFGFCILSSVTGVRVWATRVVVRSRHGISSFSEMVTASCTMSLASCALDGSKSGKLESSA